MSGIADLLQIIVHCAVNWTLAFKYWAVGIKLELAIDEKDPTQFKKREFLIYLLGVILSFVNAFISEWNKYYEEFDRNGVG